MKNFNIITNANCYKVKFNYSVEVCNLHRIEQKVKASVSDKEARKVVLSLFFREALVL